LTDFAPEDNFTIDLEFRSPPEDDQVPVSISLSVNPVALRGCHAESNHELSGLAFLGLVELAK
jgi:hypothetical protein